MQKSQIESLQHQIAALEEEKGSGFLVQEEISNMKSEKEAMERRYQEQISELETKLEETNAALVKSNETMAKMKRQFQVKLKALRDQQQSSPSPSSESSSVPPEVITAERINQ